MFTRVLFVALAVSLYTVNSSWAADEAPLHPAIGTKLVPSDVDWQHPLYETSFDDSAVLKDWRLEGGKGMSVAEGKFVLESMNDGPPAMNKNHLVCWLNKEMPADFLLEFSVCPRDRHDGLNIVFFNARGLHDENIFDPKLAPRTGLFPQYHSGDLKNYHISYWASSLEKGPRGDANVRKNPGHKLVAVGKDLVTPAPPGSFPTIRLYKRGGMIRLMVDDVVSVAYDDDGQKDGPVWNHAGWIGLRQMGRTVRCEYDHLKVFALKPADEPTEKTAAATQCGVESDKKEAGQEEAAKIQDAKAAWPPTSMQQLPPDYLERLKVSLEAATSRLERVKAETSQSSDSILWIRAGFPSLLLGQRNDEINRFFESDRFIWTANPKFGFSLFSVSYMRLYGYLNSRSGVVKGLLTPKAEENMVKGMWGVAKANSKLAEAKRDVWDTEGSENHHLSSKTSDLLAAQFLKDLPQFANEKYDDGSTLAEQYEARRAYFLKWFDERAKRGQFTEAASPSYQADSINALFNLRDFADDPVLRKKADMYLDLTYAVIAEETLRTTRGGPKSRVKVGHEYDGGMSDRGYNVLFGAPGREFEALGDSTRSTSDYFPPPAVVSLAKDISSRGTYRFSTRWPGPIAEGKGKKSGDPEGQLWRTMEPEHSVLRSGFCTPNYVLGSATVDTTTVEDSSAGYRWQGIVFASDPVARIGFEVQPNKSKDWHGFNPFYSAQDRNLMITQVWAPVPPNPQSAKPAHLKVYFSATLDEMIEEGGWIFVKDGDAFAAVRPVAGGYDWTPPWKHADDFHDNKAFITLKSEDSPVITIVNDSRDYGGDFQAFKLAVKSQPVHYADGVLKFATITFYGPRQPAEISGKQLSLSPARGYDSPFVRSEWASGLIYIRKGDDTVILDFRDPANPKKTVGAPVTAAFPSGVGTTEPIVLGKSAR